MMIWDLTESTILVAEEKGENERVRTVRQDEIPMVKI